LLRAHGVMSEGFLALLSPEECPLAAGIPKTSIDGKKIPQ
jgi:hypothetical protein